MPICEPGKREARTGRIPPTRATAVVFCCLSFSFVATGQAIQTACKDMRYESRNQIGYGPLRVRAVRGAATDAQRTPIPKSCIGVFREEDHKLIAATETDDRGRFDLKGVPDGDYRLVAKYDGFSIANAQLRIGRAGSKKTLAVQMRPAGIDTGSFVELK